MFAHEGLVLPLPRKLSAAAASGVMQVCEEQVLTLIAAWPLQKSQL